MRVGVRAPSTGKAGFLRRMLLLFAAVFVVNILYSFLDLSTWSTGKQLRGFDILSQSILAIPASSHTRDHYPAQTHLIIVAGHAVVKIHEIALATKQDSAWYLLNYQLKQDFPSIISSHIRHGLSLARADINATLIFSGGQTRHDVGPLSEAASYYYVAHENQWISQELADRIYLEEFARDSFENLLFSICRFKEINGAYPTRISVVGFDFKARRFTELHRLAIRFPAAAFSYFGLKPQSENFDHHKAVQGEKEALRAFEEDMYACHAESLRVKREKRNPFHRTIPYALSNPELADLLSWCGPEVYAAPLPWSPSLPVDAVGEHVSEGEAIIAEADPGTASAAV